MMFVCVNPHKQLRVSDTSWKQSQIFNSSKRQGVIFSLKLLRFSQPVHHSNHTSSGGSFVVFTLTREFVFELLMIYGLFISVVSKYFVKKQTEWKPKPRKRQRSLRITEVYVYGLADRNVKALCVFWYESLAGRTSSIKWHCKNKDSDVYLKSDTAYSMCSGNNQLSREFFLQVFRMYQL
jgi:hypothetical protein